MHVVIIGNGIAGITAALRLRERRPGWRISIVSGESTHHYSRPALMYLFMGHMGWDDVKPFPDGFWAERRLDLIRDWVRQVDFADRRLILHRRGALSYDRLLLATGSKPNRFGWPGQDLAGVQGLYGLRDLRALYDNVRQARRAAIVGGGLIGIELAEMLHSRGIHVTMLVREASYWGNVLPPEESAMVNRVVREQGIDLELETSLREIVDDGAGRCCAVLTEDGRRMDCDLVGLTAGVSPNLDLLRDTPLATGRGVLVDRALRTSMAGVWAAGDCAELVAEDGGRNLLQQVWYTGRLQGEVAGDGLAGETHEYDPGIWFNSAKFFDLEYQVYGRVNRRVPGERSLFWEHPDGKRSARIVCADGAVIGFNVMGLRWRHEVCERWIAERRSPEHVLEHLREAAFDPELGGAHEVQIAATLQEACA